MKSKKKHIIVYTAPTVAHHYQYASSFAELNLLKDFVTGATRFSSKQKNIDSKIIPYKRSHNIFSALNALVFRYGLDFLKPYTRYLMSLELDIATRKYLKDAKIVMMYSGCGVYSIREARRMGCKSVVEVVSTHVNDYLECLEKEADSCGIKPIGMLTALKERMILEYREADYILCASNAVRDSLINNGISAEKIRMVSYPMPQFKRKKVANLDEDSRGSQFNVLFVGQIHYRKGIKYLLEGFVEARIQSSLLRLVGPPSKSSGVNLNQLPTNVEYLGKMGATKLQAQYEWADVLVLPSVEDGFGLVVLEAISYGVVPVVSRAAGSAEIITDRENGILIEPRSSVSIAVALKLLENKECRKSLQRNIDSLIDQINGKPSLSKSLSDLVDSIL
ncbi:glycosyltransferase family 4 protein [Roseibacillus ishigakijimensis]|uniref:Glycosyltransferase family 4 protein n=1 Tax=Roseibacillus ishigakijimensis TaxID=454146 RepID=A0A934VM12_9BACT|nr:glycosyltransferase family 4 protein [Roseibacillus ishigakijimensis]MBK1833641.1 glycosyltransferase family 4 protein [Roseibacillus ishigakijimensis]